MASLDLTHVLYDDASWFSLFLALMTLTPILLMAAYASLAVRTREFLIIMMWAGQFACEGLNWIIKRIIKEERPIEHIGNGYGFPSSHSQYMGYFASFLICHMYFKHRFVSTGYPAIDIMWRITVYTAILLWGGLVAYSRYALGYHNAHQIFWGIGIGVILGVLLYVVSQLLPRLYPRSVFGKVRRLLIGNPISTFLQVRDGWEIWEDGGRGSEWAQWRSQWDAVHRHKEE